ncbi:MAG: xanthine dehydrogenase family protein molybdopterin-binding subunit [Nitrososphaerota archaeon]|nr:xanthine dehydrogenase family protein molybdopterin-binding subunit [Nitrososphaerota archaeon]
MEAGSKGFVTGRANFVDDLHLENMLHLKVLRSPYARARILKIEGNGITGKEFKTNLASVGEGSWGGDRVSVPYPALATDYVSYVGQPVAAVLAEDQYKAEDMLDAIRVDYNALKPLVDAREAMKFEPIHPGTKSNIVTKVALGQDFQSNAPVVLEDTLSNERIAANPMEPRALVVYYDGSKLTVWASTQSVHTWKEGILGSTKLPRESVRVVQMDTGGAFGTKSGFYPEYAIACYASMKTKRPVKWTETRSEHLLATSQGRGASGKIKIYADRQGKVSGLKADILVDNGAFAAGFGGSAAGWIARQLTGPYAIEKVYVTGASVFTNKVPLGPYRGAGRPEAAFFYERMMDMLSDELKLDPVKVRLRNASAKPFVSPLGLKIDPFEPFLRSAAENLGYFRRRSEANIGFSTFILVSATMPGESARIHISQGKVKVWIGGSQSGQDHEKIAQKIVSEELGISPDVIKMEPGDTDQLDQGIGTWGSRTAIVGAAALVEAAGKIRKKANEELGSYTPEDLLKHEFDVTAFHQENEAVISFGANLAKVSVDKESGRAMVEECVAYYDAGRILNKYMAESQSMGGIAQGIGQVLYEEAPYNKESGQLLAGTLEDVGVPSSSLVPNITIKLAIHPSKQGETIKGIGEASTTGTPTAVIRALEKSIGKRLSKTPLHPEEIHALLKG